MPHAHAHAHAPRIHAGMRPHRHLPMPPCRGVKDVAGAGVGAALGGLTSVGKGVLSSGKGFQDFLLKGTLVELAMAVVVG